MNNRLDLRSAFSCHSCWECRLVRSAACWYLDEFPLHRLRWCRNRLACAVRPWCSDALADASHCRDASSPSLVTFSTVEEKQGKHTFDFDELRQIHIAINSYYVFQPTQQIKNNLDKSLLSNAAKKKRNDLYSYSRWHFLLFVYLCRTA